MQTFETIDGNEAVARVAYALNEVIAIYLITPAAPMGEWADAWAAARRNNLWGTVPAVIEARWEKGNSAAEIPVWDADVCIYCGKCGFVCPHAVIRSKIYDSSALSGAPPVFKSREARLTEWKGLKYTLQGAPEDCTGCGICVDVCPARNKSEARIKAINMRPQPPLRDTERANWESTVSTLVFSGLSSRKVRSEIANTGVVRTNALVDADNRRQFI
jgi:ferredoxin